ncbi:helix-turn-helix domain-containing protein [Microbacterium sp. OR21]|uniref:helix-turn-helix domain-containing protein n=1 Tax=Microbacterium sp. OR21 TaxID=3095346 RepID=UPI0039B4ACE4
MPRRVDDYRGLTQPNRLRLLRAVQSHPGLRVAELAERCGMPLNTVRDHLRVLVEEGLVREERLHPGGRGRPPIAYHAVREADSNPMARRRVDGARRRGELLRSVTALPAERATQRGDVEAEAQLDVLYEHLDDAGLSPELDERALRFEMAPCRYRGMIAQDQATVCGTHARLVRDTLAQVDGPLEVDRLEPFLTENSCALQLRRIGLRDSPASEPVSAPSPPARRRDR